MVYQSYFAVADDIYKDLGRVVPTISDPILALRYTGFATVAAVAVYEQAIKEVFIEFAENKGRAFGAYVGSHFERINGRIKLDVIKKEYVSKFGDRYLNRFSAILKKRSGEYLKKNHRDICSSYSNIITWRNEFAHTAGISSSATFSESAQAYEDGKEIIHCLAKTMVR
jgi:RiboL-PSP-HEPN